MTWDTGTTMNLVPERIGTWSGKKWDLEQDELGPGSRTTWDLERDLVPERQQRGGRGEEGEPGTDWQASRPRAIG